MIIWDEKAKIVMASYPLSNMLGNIPRLLLTIAADFELKNTNRDIHTLHILHTSIFVR